MLWNIGTGARRLHAPGHGHHTPLGLSMPVTQNLKGTVSADPWRCLPLPLLRGRQGLSPRQWLQPGQQPGSRLLPTNTSSCVIDLVSWWCRRSVPGIWKFITGCFIWGRIHISFLTLVIVRVAVSVSGNL
jgi:hypothetical protein